MKNYTIVADFAAKVAFEDEVIHVEVTDKNNHLRMFTSENMDTTVYAEWDSDGEFIGRFNIFEGPLGQEEPLERVVNILHLFRTFPNDVEVALNGLEDILSILNS